MNNENSKLKKKIGGGGILLQDIAKGSAIKNQM